MIRNLVAIEHAYINTYHPDFMGGVNSIYNVFDPSNYRSQESKVQDVQSDPKMERGLSFEDLSGKGD